MISACCGASRWAKQLAECRPFIGDQDLFEAAERIWHALDRDDWRQAFAAHPKIGDPLTLPSPPEEGGEGRVRGVGGWVVDTPGIRQFQLWDMMPEEVEGFFPEFRPYVPLCAYPDCTHTHEDRCAVKRAVERRQLSGRRYTSYLGLFAGESWD